MSIGLILIVVFALLVFLQRKSTAHKRPGYKPRGKVVGRASEHIASNLGHGPASPRCSVCGERKCPTKNAPRSEHAPRHHHVNKVKNYKWEGVTVKIKKPED